MILFNPSSRKIEDNIRKLEALEKKAVNTNQENKALLKLIEENGVSYMNFTKERDTEFDETKKAFEKIISEKSKGFPWLSEAIADFYRYKDIEIENLLRNKKHPAVKASDEHKEISLQNRNLRGKLKVTEYLLNYYESLFPWITEYVGDDMDDLIEGVADAEHEEENDDPVLKFVQRAEYNSLTPTERNQRALDRYKASRKKNWQIGRDYERYIGYLYENKGFEVEYTGIEMGKGDLGRDLICKKGDAVEIIQCKCWSFEKTIHEKHINQLYGTAIQYYLSFKNTIKKKQSLTLFPELISSGKIGASFYTSTSLSEKAQEFADALGVKIYQNTPLKEYPLIKCNISNTGEKIYHLPFDQQYDRTLIRNQGEFYASTVTEAENKGFRRAFRWRGVIEV